jgi:hypothetical protein
MLRHIPPLLCRLAIDAMSADSRTRRSNLHLHPLGLHAMTSAPVRKKRTAARPILTPSGADSD